MVLFVNCYVVFHFLKFFFLLTVMLIYVSVHLSPLTLLWDAKHKWVNDIREDDTL